MNRIMKLLAAKGVWLFFLAVLQVFFCLNPLQAQDTSYKELVAVLKAKGVLTEEEAADLNHRIDEKNKRDFKVFYKNGLKFETRDKAFKGQIGGRVQMDYLNPEADHPENDSFFLRRARLFAEGTLFEKTDYKFQIAFGQGGSKLNDGYLEFNYFSWAHLKLGQYKEPFSLEELTSSKYVDFIERSITANSMAPSRDLGIMLHANFLSNRLGYGLGIFNGNGSNKKRDENEDKDLAARIWGQPFLKSGYKLLEGIHLGGSLTTGQQEADLSGDKFKTAPGTSFFQFAEGVRSDDQRNRFGAEAAWVLGPFALKGEWMQTELLDLELGGQKNDVDIDGWYIGASWFITGEKKSPKKGKFGRLTPKNRFNPTEGKFGAFELVARVEKFDLDSDLIKKGFGTGSDQVDVFAVGLNWYLNNMVLIRLNYLHNSFDDKLGRLKDDNEDVFLSRFQVEF